MSNGFQFYEGTTSDSATTPKITVRKGGVLILTKAAVDMLGEDVTHVQIGYNEKTRAVGIRRATEDARGRYRLRSQRNSPSRLIDGKRLFMHHGLIAEKARAFNVEKFGDDGIIGFTLTAEPEAAEAAPKVDAKAGKARDGSRRPRARGGSRRWPPGPIPSPWEPGR